jgi:hypothetical protein
MRKDLEGKDRLSALEPETRFALQSVKDGVIPTSKPKVRAPHDDDLAFRLGRNRTSRFSASCDGSRDYRQRTRLPRCLSLRRRVLARPRWGLTP